MGRLLEEKTAVEWSTKTFAGWERYPTNLSSYDRNAIDGEALNLELSSFSEKLFCGKDCSIGVDVLDIEVGMQDEDASRVCRYQFSSDEKLERHLLLSNAPRLRIISIAQMHSLLPLNITEEAMRKILTYHDVSPDFLTNLFCCGNSPQASEAGSGHFCSTYSDGSSEMMYTLKYVEKNGRAQADDTDTWILLHPKTESVFQRRLATVFLDARSARQIQLHPTAVHLLLFSSYIENWRWYLGQLSETFLNAADIALTIDLDDNADYRLSFSTLQSLRNLEDKIFPVTAALQASISTIDWLQEHDKAGHASQQQEGVIPLASQKRLMLASDRLRGNLTSAETLRHRIGGIIHLLGDALNHKGQATAMDVNRHMLGLTKESVDDSATVRVVGVMTLIYLPATFVATMLGMNLFTFEFAASKIKIAKDFWIFLALAVPLTVMTVGCWVYLSFKKKSRRAITVSQTQGHKISPV